MRFRPRHTCFVALASGLAIACGSSPAADTGSSGTSEGPADTTAGTTGTDGGTTTSTGPATTTSSDEDSGDDDTTGEPGELVGSFLLQLDEPAPPADGSTSLFGKIYDGPTPLPVVWETAATEGDCVLLTPRVPFCTTPCGSDSACVEDETCQLYPTALGAGDITVEGVTTESGETTFTMSPLAENYQPPAGIVLAYPGVDEGSPVTLTAAGGAVEAFDVDADGVAPLVLESDEISLDPATDLSLAWTAAADPTASRVHVELDISHHGGTKGTVECEVDDTGALTIPAALVGALIDLGVAGFPSIVVRRESTGWTNVAVGRIDLVVSSSASRIVDIEGLTSCNDDEDCPDAQTCQEDLTCQ